jgi:hypothetical protein
MGNVSLKVNELIPLMWEQARLYNLYEYYYTKLAI